MSKALQFLVPLMFEDASVWYFGELSACSVLGIWRPLANVMSTGSASVDQ